MKKILGILLVLSMLLPLVAMAEDVQSTNGSLSATVTANGVVKSQNTYDITAPYSGVVLPFSWEIGDSVASGDALFEMDTLKVYAPSDGVVQALFVKEGDLCESVISQYGMIAAIEKNPALVVTASSSGAYDDSANKLIHLGETIYFYETSDKENEGEGDVISIEGNEYIIELKAGDFESGDAVKIFRDEKMGTKTCIGSGTVARSTDVPITVSGRVIDSAVVQGQKVKKGQLLFELASADAESSVNSAKVSAPHAGAIGSVAVISGQQVYKGQVLATVHDLSALNVIAEVDEVDLDLVKAGDSLTVLLDRYPDQKVTGTVTSISRIGIQKQNATYFNVEIAITTSLEVLPGMNGTVWLAQAE